MKRFRLTQLLTIWLIGLSIIFSDGISHAQQTLPFIFEKGKILFEVTCNDSLKGTFCLDTGAGVHIISNELLEQLPSTTAGYLSAFNRFGSRIDLENYHISSISIGQFREENPIVAPFDLGGGRYDGLISSKFLEHHIVTVDFKENLMIFENSISLGARIQKGTIIPIKVQRYRDKGLDIFADFQVGDSLIVECELDTGSWRNIVHSRYLDKLGISEDSEGVKSAEREFIPGKPEKVYGATVPYLCLAYAPDIRMENPGIMFTNIIYDGVIGTSFFKDYVITFNVPEKYIVVAK